METLVKVQHIQGREQTLRQVLSVQSSMLLRQSSQERTQQDNKGKVARQTLK